MYFPSLRVWLGVSLDSKRDTGRSHSRRRVRLSFERLEARIALTGNLGLFSSMARGTLSITAAPAQIQAGGQGQFTISRSNSASAATVTLKIDKSSSVPAGYTLTGTGVSLHGSMLSVAFAAGEATQGVTFTAPANVSGEAEAAHSLKLDLETSNLFKVLKTLGTGTIKIGANGLLVTNTAASGDGSLAQAVANANSIAGANVIAFAADPGQTFATARTIDLSGGLTLDNSTSYPISNFLLERSTITIDGPAAGVTIKGVGPVFVNGDYSDFGVDSGTLATLENLTITNGGYSGGIDNSVNGTLTVQSCTISGNPFGGITNYGTMTVLACTISGNRAGSGIQNVAGTLTVINSVISNNSGNAGGGVSGRGGGMTVLQNDEIYGNSANLGGGVYDSAVIGGVAGTLLVDGGTDISGNTAGGGAGIFLINVTATVSYTTISNNKATSAQDSDPSYLGDGGGVLAADGALTLYNTTLAGNTATHDGGGLYDQTIDSGDTEFITASNVTFYNNTAGRDGGGIDNAYGVHSGPSLTLTQCTITANLAGTARRRRRRHRQHQHPRDEQHHSGRKHRLQESEPVQLPQHLRGQQRQSPRRRGRYSRFPGAACRQRRADRHRGPAPRHGYGARSGHRHR